MRNALIGLALLSVCATAGAVEHPVSVLGRVYIDTNCNGVIDSGDVLVNGVDISLQLGDGTVLGVAQTGEFGLTGVYAFPSDMAPVAPNTGTNYTLTLLLPQGFSRKNAIPGPYSTRVNSGTLAFNLPTSVTGTSSSYDFLIKQTSCFYSDTQCGWGTLPRCYGQTFLSSHFTDVYSTNPVVVGGINTLTFTTARAIQDFLPQNAPVRVLTSSAVDPHSSRLSDLAGNVLALKLNVDFSDAGVTTAFFGSLHLLTGPLAGMTVRDVLALGNQALGGDLSGLPNGVNLCDLNDVIERINQNFED
ncbi:MAG TPA: hypothetical protein VG820_13600, partial [Fimbriimonadaceae bacterium]|nr:hypothetical protein [Fimbriimonadaceae bacterium]